MSKIKYHSTKDQFTHFSSMTTRWRDMDFRQHINHAAYLTYFETSRLEFAQKFFDESHTFIMASLTIDYHNQLTHPANLTIGQKVVEVGNKSFKMLGAIFKEEEINPIVTTLATLVCFNYKTQETYTVPESIKDKFNQ